MFGSLRNEISQFASKSYSGKSGTDPLGPEVVFIFGDGCQHFPVDNIFFGTG